MYIIKKKIAKYTLFLLLIVYHYNFISPYIILNYKFSIISNEIFYSKYNITTMNRICGNPCKIYRTFIFSTIKYVKFFSLVDIVPSIVKCKIYYKLFKKYGLLYKAKHNDYQYQYLEISKKIYSKYIKFKGIYLKKIYTFLQNISNIHNTIGIHYRINDKCFLHECDISKEIQRRYYNHIKKLYIENLSVILISTLNNKIAKKISNGFKYIQYMPYINPIHISINRNITNDEISKLVGEIILIASAKYLVLSLGSTFSGLILSLGGLDEKGNKKNFYLYNSIGCNVNISNIDIFTAYKCITVFYSKI